MAIMKSTQLIPDQIVESVDRLSDEANRLLGLFASPRTLDTDEELTLRMRLTGWRPNDRVSAGGTCRLVRTADETWLAINLARPEDVEALPAVFGCDESFDAHGDFWNVVERLVAERAADVVLENAIAFGLAVARVGESKPLSIREEPSRDERASEAKGFDPAELTVVDLSSLWAGPLVGRLLSDLGCRVVKVESAHRPDGARHGHPEFFHHLNAMKESVVLDFRSEAGRAELRRMIEGADVVIEASRPRALEQLGIERRRVITNGSVRVWLSITAHGSMGEAARRVGFGDDAAAAGGLLTDGADGPRFIGDAVADPITGIIGFVSTMHALLDGRRGIIDVSLAGSAALVARGLDANRIVSR